MKIYVIQDRVSGQFGPVFEAANAGVVKRDFLQMVCDPHIPDHVISDSIFFELGSFNQDPTHPALFCNVTPQIIFRGDEYEFVEARKAAIAAYRDCSDEEGLCISSETV